MSLQGINLIHGLIQQLDTPELLRLQIQLPFLPETMNHPVDITPAPQLQSLRNVIKRWREPMDIDVLPDELQQHPLPFSHYRSRKNFSKNIPPPGGWQPRTSDPIFCGNI
jgi:hypothetical protein